MSLIVIRLFPSGGEAIDGRDFSGYLTDVTISVEDLNVVAGPAQVGDPATFTPPPDDTHPEIPDSSTLIVQHFRVDPVLVPLYQAAATAVIEVAPPHPPAGRPEHATRDLRLAITRGGRIVDRRIYMNVPEAPGGIPVDRSTFPDLEPTALYLALPAPGREIDPTDAYVELPADGSPPPYDQVLNAVARVLGDDPAGVLSLSPLSVDQARHIAREIVWNQKFRPLPGPTGAHLGDLFTVPTSDDDNAERGRLDGQLTAYYAAGDADAERLTGYVVALSTAVDAEARSTAATEAGLTFPILPGQSGTGERRKNARVLLTALPATSRFTVPARYFYALGAGLPVAYDSDQRYRSAILADDERLRTMLVTARDAGTIAETPPPAPPGIPAGEAPVADAPPVSIAAAVRRLRALGDTGGSRATLDVTGEVRALVDAWLAVTADDIDIAFWDGILTSQPSGHLELVLCALTRGYVVPTDNVPLRTKLRTALAVADAAALAAVTESAWRAALTSDPTWPDDLPTFTLPGSLGERLTAFISEVRSFFALAPLVAPLDPATPGATPVIRTPFGDPISRFVAAYAARAGADYTFGGATDPTHRREAIDDVASALYPGDERARRWLEGAVRAVDELVALAGAVPLPIRFSVVEALYARGFTGRVQVAALTRQQFRDALVGTVAADLADTLIVAAGGPAVPDEPADEPFIPVNPDGCLVDCVPPEHLSPFGTVAYLKDLLTLRTDAGCDDPRSSEAPALGDLVATRRGPLADLSATTANAGTPLPVVDLVNESLQQLAAIPASSAGAVHDTARDEVAGHLLAGGSATAPGFRHDPATLLAALPEHSTPTVATGFDALRHDVGHPLLPYVQGLDVNRTYLQALGTCRFELMRAFRWDITEFVLDPALEPAGFRRHVRRYPLRLELALEYLCISYEEYDLFYASSPEGGVPAWRIYGFADPSGEGECWYDVAVRVPEFLERTGIGWCDLVELWRSGIVPFCRLTRQVPRSEDTGKGEKGRTGAKARKGEDGGTVGDGGAPDPQNAESSVLAWETAEGFPTCEPCHLDQYALDFGDDVVGGLRRVAIVIRLWRTLRTTCAGGFSLADLADVHRVLGLFDDDGSFRPDMIRQLAALQLLRTEFGVPLHGGTGTGTERSPILALWAGPDDPRWDPAVHLLLDYVRRHAVRRYCCRPRPPEFLEVLAANLDPISALVGFDPSTPADTWHSRPTHTLRLAEVLAKLYASDLGVGELLFLATTDDHLQGDDPFPLQSPNEALDDPLELPDDDRPGSLWSLRERLLATSSDDPEQWTWTRIETVFVTRFGHRPPAAGPDPLYLLGARFFPTVLEAAGVPVPPADRRWRVELPGSTPAMWNTPAGGPFRYVAEGLTAEIPLRDADVIAKLARIRQLDAAEQQAVRELIAGPRAVLASLGFLFDDFEEAVRYLSEEPDEATRFRFVQAAVARTVARGEAIADHLARHVTAVTRQQHAGTADLALRLLTELHGDENRATGPWEDDAGHAPDLTWDGATGGALAALLALTGTGLLGEYTPSGGSAVRWRELRGPLLAFGPAGTVRNPTNAPVPGLIPALDLGASDVPGRFVGIRNGFALSDAPGEGLGGVEGYEVCWTGALLVDEPGRYTFYAGAPAPDGEVPSREGLEGRRWRVVLRRGQRTWVPLSRHWPGRSDAPHFHADLDLRRGAYDLEVHFARTQPEFDDADDVVATTTGFELAYAGPDSGGRPVAIPRTHLYRRTQDPWRLDLGLGEDLTGSERAALAGRYTGSLRDIRRTYQRAFKALLLAHRLDLLAEPAADDGQSELDHLLGHADRFSGAAYRRDGGTVTVHLADLDPDLLPVADPYLPPDPATDGRAAPTPARRQALTDWSERLFDYTVLRHTADPSPAQPAWLLFHESAEGHPDIAGDLLRYLGVDLRHAIAVLRYRLASGGGDVQLVSDDLVDEMWPVRVQHADLLLRRIRRCFLVADIRAAQPSLWADDDPASPPDDTSPNADLARFVADGLIENGRPRRYGDLAATNDGLRARGRAALLAYLTRQDRVALPWGEPVRQPRQLSDLLLIDVEAGGCERVTRVDEAIAAVQTLVGRARLGLEPGFVPSPDFLALWDARYGTLLTWQACVRRHVYRENWVDVDELAVAERSEAFGFLTGQLRWATLTRPEPGGVQAWVAAPAPTHPGIQILQVRDPSTLQAVEPAGHGFDLLGTPDRHARPSWLAAVGALAPPNEGGGDEGGGDGGGDDGNGGGDGPGIGLVEGQPAAGGRAAGGPGEGGPGEGGPGEGEEEHAGRVPCWIEAAVRLGTRFLRVAAAGDPPASASPATLLLPPPASSCCAACAGRPAPLMDEYYFWLTDAREFAPRVQDASWDWHDPQKLPGLLAWSGENEVRLAWCRVHHGEFGPVGLSTEAVRVSGPPQLLFAGRVEDSLTFAVDHGKTPVGFPADPPPGFRYDLADGEARALPQLPAAPLPPTTGPLHPGGLPAFPYFVYHAPGAPLAPTSAYPAAVCVAAALRARCEPEAALRWYELAFDPLHGDASWLHCDLEGEGGRDAEGEGEGSGRLGRCCTDSTRATDDRVRRRAITLHYLETLLDWTDLRLRGRWSRPTDAEARVILTVAATLLGERPRRVLDAATEAAPVTVADFVPHPAPPNPRLLSLYDRVEDRLALIRACQDVVTRLPLGRPTAVRGTPGDRVTPGDQMMPQLCAPAGCEPAGCEPAGCVPACPYRFAYLISRARELAAQVRSLGSALQQAYERGDAEFLLAMRTDQERQLQASAVGLRQAQWRDADWQVQALGRTKQIAQTNRRYFAALVEAGLNRGENDYQSLTEQSVASHATSIPLEAAGQALGFIPDIWLGVAGLGPLNANQLPLGTKLAGVFATAARIAGTVGQIAGITAGERLTQAGWERREEDWRHQVEVLDLEIEQIERQILGAERRRDAALHELNDQQLRSEHAVAALDLLRERLTGHALYLWLQQESASIYRRTYELALQTARQAQHAFNFERGHTAEDLLDVAFWDDLHEGLLAGDRLELATRRMEQCYLDLNVREYELVKHVSLRLTRPLDFLRLQATGACEIELPEWLFDQDYPGHYLRRIKNVSLTIPCVVGPYTGVHARLTLLSSTTRVRPELIRPPGSCCPDTPRTTCDQRCRGCGGAGYEGCGCESCGGCGCCPEEADPGDGYSLLPADVRAVRDFAAREAVATSTGQADPGLFEVNFRDERYLPFEFHGAVSRWLLELPQENNQFDLATVSDVVLHLNYTAREGGAALRAAAQRQAGDRLQGDGLLVLDVEHDLPDAWYELHRASSGTRRLPLRLSRAMFPFRPGGQRLDVTTVEFFMEAPHADPSRHHAVRYRPAHPDRDSWTEPEEFEDVECVAGAEWPGLFHGVLTDLGGSTLTEPESLLGTVELPPDLGRVCRIWLLLGYAAHGCPPGRCSCRETRHEHHR